MKKVHFYGLLVACVAAAGCSDSNGVDSEKFGIECSEQEECGNTLVCLDGYCQQKLSKGDKCGYMYTFCGDDLECMNGVCSGNGSENTKCDKNNPCALGKACISGKCVELSNVGDACTSNAQCAQGKCVDNVCHVTVSAGQACDKGFVCGDELECAGGVCKSPVEVGGDCRSSMVYCKGGICIRGVCIESSGDANCEDTDGDTISDDYDSCDVDTDKDGIVDCEDLDSDGDTIPDTVEYGSFSACDEPVDNDGDGIYDFMDLDSDANGIPDSIEGRIVKENGAVEYPDTDGDGLYDFADSDNDDDFVDDITEIYGMQHQSYTEFGEKGPRGADCNGDTIPDDPGSLEKPFDCDGDTIPDYNDFDSDNDGITDFYESINDSNKDGFYDRYSQDSDGDGLPDSVERGNGEMPAVSGNSKLADFQNPDIDSDGLMDGMEVVCRTPVSCEAGQIYCGDGCIDVTADNKNCGGCGIVCTSDETCEDSACVLHCSDGLEECNHKCIDLSVVDNHNCGVCGLSCAASDVCADDDGVHCVPSSEEDVNACEGQVGKSYCWGKCLDTASFETDANNCGECGVVCESGKCTDGVCEPVEKPSTEGGFKELNTRFVADADGDTIGDSIEYIAAKYKCMNKASYASDAEYSKFCDEKSAYFMTEFVCDPKKGAIADKENGIEGAFDFYFVLPYEEPEQQDILNFKPQVSKLDVVFDLDTTNSMGPEVANLKSKINASEAEGGIIAQIRKRVEDSAFGVVRFDDFPTRPTKNSKYDYLSGNGIEEGGYGRADECGGTQTDPAQPFKCDLPFSLVGRPEKDAGTVQANVNKLSLHHGGDFPEAGYESLWQIVMGDDTNNAQVSWYKFEGYTAFKEGSIAYTPKTADRWGGAQFRNSTLPVVVHITDTTAHDTASNCTCDNDKSKQNCTCKPYDPAYVENAHYSDKVHEQYQKKGARVITVYDAGSGKGDSTLVQLTEIAKVTEAVVPACAFKSDASTWKCGEGLCCTTTKGQQPVDINGQKQCILSYTIESGDRLSTTLVDGVDALVKYAASDVAAIVKGNPIDGYENVDTSCFINGVVAFDTTVSGEKTLSGYVAPPFEPEHSCNPTAVPSKYYSANETDGYTNFAIGTSSSDKEGAQLNFVVKAQNNCVRPTKQMQVFEAVIELVNPKTGMSYGERKVSIVVPAAASSDIN